MLSDRYSDDGRTLLPLNEMQAEARRSIVEKVASGRYRLVDAGCPLCGDGDDAVVAAKDRYGLPCRTVVCRGCGLVRTSPRLDDRSLAAFYDAEYRPLYVASSSATDGFVADQVRRGRQLVSWLERHGELPAPGRLVVEVGVGAGGVLAAFRERGLECIGCDLGTAYLREGRRRFDFPLVVGDLGSVPLPTAPALVVYSHVLEHLGDPVAELKRVRDVLAPDGRLVVEVPGIKALRHYEGDPLRYLQNAHLFHFSAVTLTAVAARARFDAVAIDELVRACFRPTDHEVLVTTRDYGAVLQSLRRAERWGRRAAPLFRVARRLRGTLAHRRQAEVGFLGDASTGTRRR